MDEERDETGREETDREGAGAAGGSDESGADESSAGRRRRNESRRPAAPPDDEGWHTSTRQSAQRPASARGGRPAETRGVLETRGRFDTPGPLATYVVQRRMAQRRAAPPRGERDREDVAPTVSGLYSGLAEQPPHKQAHLIAQTMFQSASGGVEGRAVTLAECLASTSAQQRRAVVTLYWRTVELLMKAQAYSEAGQQLEALSRLILQQRSRAGGSLAMLELDAALQAVQAAQLGNEAKLLAARAELTNRLGRPLSEAWVVPSTAPHAGRYNMGKGGASPEQTSRQSAVAQCLEALGHRASAVVLCDELRAAATESADGVPHATGAVREQLKQTLNFLSSLTRYNLSIEEYAAAILGPSSPVNKYVGALVVTKSSP